MLTRVTLSRFFDEMEPPQHALHLLHLGHWTTQHASRLLEGTRQSALLTTTKQSQYADRMRGAGSLPSL